MLGHSCVNKNGFDLQITAFSEKYSILIEIKVADTIKQQLLQYVNVIQQTVTNLEISFIRH